MSVCVLLSFVPLFCMNKLSQYQGKILSNDGEKSLVVCYTIEQFRLPEETKKKIRRDYYNLYSTDIKMCWKIYEKLHSLAIRRLSPVDLFEIHSDLRQKIHEKIDPIIEYQSRYKTFPLTDFVGAQYMKEEYLDLTFGIGFFLGYRLRNSRRNILQRDSPSDELSLLSMYF